MCFFEDGKKESGVFAVHEHGMFYLLSWTLHKDYDLFNVEKVDFHALDGLHFCEFRGFPCWRVEENPHQHVSPN